VAVGEVVLPQRRGVWRERLRRRRLYWFAVLVLILLFLGRFAGLTAFVNRGVGPLLAAYGLFLLRNHLLRLPLEVSLFLMFGVVWAATGLVVAPSTALFLGTYKLLVQLCILFLVIIGVTWRFDGFQAMVWALVATATGVLVHTLISGELMGVVEAYQAGERSSSMQLAGVGLLDNANGFGFLMLVGIMGLVFVFDRMHSKLPQALIVGLIGILGAGVVLSASRKTFLSLLLFLVLWSLLCHFRGIVSNPIRVVAVMILMVAVWAVLGFVMRSTFLGERLAEAMTLSQAVRHDAERWELYAEVWKVAKENPVSGVGLGNFRVVSRLGYYAHSDFGEVLADTGFVGILLYGGLFVVFARRCLHTARYATRSAVRREARFLLAVLIVFLVIGLGRPHFIQLFSIAWLGALIGHSKVLADLAAGSARRDRQRTGAWVSMTAADVRQLRGYNS